MVGQVAELQVECEVGMMAECLSRQMYFHLKWHQSKLLISTRSLGAFAPSAL